MGDWGWAFVAVVCTILVGVAISDVAKAIRDVAAAIRAVDRTLKETAFGPDDGYNAKGRG